MEENLGAVEDGGQGQFVRVILADTQAIFRAGLRKVFALEYDIRVVGQAETLAQTQSAAAKFTADVLIFESALTPNPWKRCRSCFARIRCCAWLWLHRAQMKN